MKLTKTFAPSSSKRIVNVGGLEQLSTCITELPRVRITTLEFFSEKNYEVAELVDSTLLIQLDSEELN